MAHLGARAFDEINGEVVQTTAFVNRNKHIKDYLGTYARLIDGKSENEKSTMFLSGKYNYTANADNFSKIPGSPVAYWVSEEFKKAFTHKKLSDYLSPKQGTSTGDNTTFLRLWYEVNHQKIDFHHSKGTPTILKWYPATKGGEYRKWYGNNDYVVDWQNDAQNIKNCKGSAIRNSGDNFKEGLTWTGISSSYLGIRYCPEGFVFLISGKGITGDHKILKYILGFCCSKVADHILRVTSPTMSFEVGYIAGLPIITTEKQNKMTVDELVEENISLSKADWDSFETSWDFVTHPLVRCMTFSREEMLRDKEKNITDMNLIDGAFINWSNECYLRFEKLKANEEELNRIFIDIYGLQDELTPEVEDKDVTVRKADLTREIKSLISYAVGCMFGRYSLDVDGLAYAGGEWDSTKYKSFIPDDDNCIPITDTRYFEDDIVSRFCEFIKVVYGEDTLEENLDYIAQALGNKGNSSREVIRNYFLNDFYKDHCKIYQKRPIYWLFDSGKQNGFKALIYIHRYNADTIGNLRVEYLHRVQRIYESEIEREQDTIDHTTNAHEKKVSENRKEKLQRQLKETKEYDEKIAHLALSRIEIDLDDGVKTNYDKIQTGRDGKKLDVLGKI